MQDAAVLAAAVVTVAALSACVFRGRPVARGAAAPRPSPREGETVLYCEFLNDGSLWVCRAYAFSKGSWRSVRTCYPASRKGCGPDFEDVWYPPAASVAGLQQTEINSDRAGFLSELHPKSRFVDDPELWAALAVTP